MMADELAAAVGNEAARELIKAHDRIKHCVGQLTDAQVWRRSSPSMNSIGNLILHLCGNVRQWINSGIGGASDVRNRPAEFSARGPILKEELLLKLDNVVEEAASVLRRITAQQMLEIRRIQESEITGLTAIFDSVPHFRGHTQEIIHMTREQLGDAYRFAWTPPAPD